MIRKGNYEVASVPEPSTLFGYEAVDAVVRAMAGEPPAKFVQPTYIITKDNVDRKAARTTNSCPRTTSPATTRTSGRATIIPAD